LLIGEEADAFSTVSSAQALRILLRLLKRVW
jgi:hypothetical protein